MKIKTTDLTDRALRWAVATLEGYTNLRRGVFSGELVMDPPRKEYGAVEFSSICYGTDWAQGGPIVDREGISLSQIKGHPCRAYIGTPAQHDFAEFAPEGQPLIAAMRCFVASRLGDEVDIPEELQPQAHV